MNITFFSLTRDNSSAYSESKKIIAECVNAFAGKGEKIKNFSSPKRMLIAASQELRSTDVVVIAVQSNMYNTVKKMICSSFNLKTQRYSEIYDELYPLYDKGKLTEKSLDANSVFPVDANIFATQDFKCCGFSVVAGSQSIVVLPLDPIKTAETVFGSLYDFLAEFGGIENVEEVAKFKRAAMMMRIVTLLKKSGSKLVFVPLGGRAVLSENIQLTDSDQNYISFAAKPETRKSYQSAKEYIVAVTQKARIDSSADYACAVSSAFASNRDNSVFVLYAAADENDTVVTRLMANEGETPKEASVSAVENALILTGNKIVQNNMENARRNNKRDKVLRKKYAILSAAAAVGATAVSAIVALLLK